MRRFDYSFLKESVPSDIVSIAMIIADLRAKEDFRKINSAQTFDALRERAIIESVRESNAIEGIVTTEARIRDIINGESPLTHGEQEISGYKDVLNLIHTQHDQIDITEELICEFHRQIMQETSPRTAGKNKTTENHILEIDEKGNRRVRFSPTSVADTPMAMSQMILAYCEVAQDEQIPPLLWIPCVILDFLCIHPFLDGNGRVSRLLTLLLLYKNGYDIGRYISIEGMISRYKDAYYAALADSSVDWHRSKNNYVPFVIFFQQILYRCYKELDECFMDESLKGANKTQRIEAVLMNSIVPVSKADILNKLPDVSVRTVEAVLRRLQKEDRITKIGANKNARYMKK